MKIVFPSNDPNGLDSPVFNHFGTATGFIMVDTETDAVDVIENQDAGHAHGACDPMKALGDAPVDVVVAGGIGGGALARLRSLGIRVYQTPGGTVRENLEGITSGRLMEFPLTHKCGGHGPDGGCDHH